MRVLVVDDNPVICQNIKSKILRLDHPCSYEVDIAHSVMEAKHIIHDIQFVITDINMPKNSGLVLIEYIRKQNASIPIVVLSGYDDYEFVREAFLAGANDYLLKPVSFSELHQRIKKLNAGWKDEVERVHLEPVLSGMGGAIDYIESHLGSAISMMEVAESVAMSYSYFSKTFNEHTGMSFPKYLLQVRMEKAKEYLQDPKVKINQIAQKLGYKNDAHHFSRDFAKYTGISPTVYRKKHWTQEVKVN